MKILYAAYKYDYGERARGLSFEHFNFFDSLLNMGHDILYFDIGSLTRSIGSHRTSQRLLEVARSEQPDLMLTLLVENELEPRVVRTISEETSTVTLNWFCDDHWRFESFSSRWAWNFNWVVTTARSAVPKYAAIGYHNAIKSQWACNQYGYSPLGLPAKYDVSFVGGAHGDRRTVVRRLRAEGINIHVFGLGWPSGRLDQQAMLRVFSQSRINLNLSNSSVNSSLSSRVVGLVLRRAESARVHDGIRQVLVSKLVDLEAKLGTRPATEQIKARNFEVPGCGGFQLTGLADNLDDYFALGREVACYGDPAELAAKLRYYLANEDERAAIAATGHQRTLREHTYVHRFAEIFRRMDLVTPSAECILAGRIPKGSCDEVGPRTTGGYPY